MKSSYTVPFAQVYNQRWTGFVSKAGPQIRALYEQRCSQGEHTLLDVCCGTGQLALQFLRAGYTVTGLDSSEPMLAHARSNCLSFVSSGEAVFVQADAADFALPSRFGLAVSTFDALNHLAGRQALQSCFVCVHRALFPDGMFVFDLNSVVGLRHWNNVTIEDAPDAMIVKRGMYDEERRQGRIRMSGFVREDVGGWLRFDETFVENAWSVAEVTGDLFSAGFSAVYQARTSDLTTPCTEPESEGRVSFVARV